MPDPSPLSVLIVDDEEDVRFLLKFQLSSVAGVQVVGSAGDGAEAVELCRTLRPSVVVMDLLMPGVNGFQAIVQLREEMPHVGVVAYTAVAGQFVRNEMARLGVPLVLKSADVQPLVEALHVAVASL